MILSRPVVDVVNAMAELFTGHITSYFRQHRWNSRGDIHFAPLVAPPAINIVSWVINCVCIPIRRHARYVVYGDDFGDRRRRLSRRTGHASQNLYASLFRQKQTVKKRAKIAFGLSYLENRMLRQHRGSLRMCVYNVFIVVCLLCLLRLSVCILYSGLWSFPKSATPKKCLVEFHISHR